MRGLGSCIGGGYGNPLQCSCLENPKDGGAWRAAIYGVAQSRTRLKRLSSSSRNGSDVVINCTESALTLFIRNYFRSIQGSKVEKAMATHSSTLAWKIPWTEEPGRLQSMGSRRVGHD